MRQSSIQQRKCRRCTRAMVSITLEIDGRSRTLRSCSNCDIREWESESGDTSLDGVLSELATQARS
jgi:hypothetical protein